MRVRFYEENPINDHAFWQESSFFTVANPASSIRIPRFNPLLRGRHRSRDCRIEVVFPLTSMPLELIGQVRRDPC